MKSILVATDFSTRSDRALRRASLLARKHEAALSLVHVIVDNRSERMVEADRGWASRILSEMDRTLRTMDAIDCSHRVMTGEASEGLIAAASQVNPDLLVVGPHRTHTFKDAFIGATVEETLRASRWPVLVANGVPAGPYRRILVALDFSDASRDALRRLLHLGLNVDAEVSVLHVFDVTGASLIARAAMTEEQIQDYLAEEQNKAARQLAAFMRELDFAPAHQISKQNDTSVANAILFVAEEMMADLIVVGTQGLSGMTKLLLGSVTEELIRKSDHDVLATPPARSD